MKGIKRPWKLVVTAFVAIVLAVLALFWHSEKILPQIIKQVGEEQLKEQ